MKQKNDLVRTVKARRLEDASGNTAYTANGYKHRVEIINYTGATLYVKNQSNIPYSIPSSRNTLASSHGDDHIEIRVTSGVYGNEDVREMLKLMNKVVAEDVTLSRDARYQFERLKNLIDHEPVQRRHNLLESVRHFYIQRAEIMSAGYAYIQECDLLVSFNEDIVFEHHPQSNEAWSSPDIRSRKEARGASGNFIRVIDNDNTRDKWFYYSARQIVEVTAIQDHTKDSGVYFCSMEYEDGRNVIKEEFMSFAEAEHRLGLFATREAAASNGNPENVAKADEARWRAEMEKTRRKLQEAEQELTAQRHRYEAELMAAKHISTITKEQIDMKSEERKDKHEEKSLKRKDRFDKKDKKRKAKLEKLQADSKKLDTIIKYAPIVIASVAAVGTWLATRNNNNNNIHSGSGATGMASVMINTRHQPPTRQQVRFLKENGIEVDDDKLRNQIIDEEGLHSILKKR